MPDALEERLSRTACAVGEPPADLTARARAAALAATPSAPAHGRVLRLSRAARRPVRAAMALAGAGGLAVLLAALLISTPSDRREPAAPGLRPDIGSLGPVTECVEPRLLEPCVTGTEEVRRADPAIAGAPWLYLTADGAQPRLRGSARRPSLVFPPGTTYGQALDALVVSAVLTGRLPEGTRLGPPLPQGAVLLRPSDPSRGIAVDLRAPFGYIPRDGRIYSSVLVREPPASSSGRTVWPGGTRIATPALPSCMVIAERDAGTRRCGAGEEPMLTGPDAGVLPLPVVRWTPATLAEEQAAAGVTPADRRPSAPELSLPLLGSTATPPARMSLADLEGSIVVLNFWASWCEPCALEAPVLEEVAARYRGSKDVVVLGVDVQDLSQEALAFVERNGVTHPSLRDGSDEAQRAFEVPALPETFVIDKRGRVAFRLPGALLNERTVTAPIDLLLDESP